MGASGRACAAEPFRLGPQMSYAKGENAGGLQKATRRARRFCRLSILYKNTVVHKNGIQRSHDHTIDMLTFATKKLSTGANRQKEVAAVPFVRAKCTMGSSARAGSEARPGNERGRSTAVGGRFRRLDGTPFFRLTPAFGLRSPRSPRRSTAVGRAAACRERRIGDCRIGAGRGHACKCASAWVVRTARPGRARSAVAPAGEGKKQQKR